MNVSKGLLRDILGLAFIVSTILAALYILLDVLAVFAYVNHEEHIASVFFHESFYLLVFFIPPYFIGKYINRQDMVNNKI